MPIHQLERLRIRLWMLITFGTLCAILLVIAGLFFFSLRSIDFSSQRQAQAMNLLARVEDAGQDVETMQATVLRQLLASDPGDIRRLDQAARDIEEHSARDISDEQEFAGTDKERRLYDDVMQTRKIYWDETQPVFAAGKVIRITGGKELADRVQALDPHIRVLFTSAYTEHAVVHQGVLNKGAALLQKPFTPSALAHRVRAVLDEPEASERDAKP